MKLHILILLVVVALTGCSIAANTHTTALPQNWYELPCLDYGAICIYSSKSGKLTSIEKVNFGLSDTSNTPNVEGIYFIAPKPSCYRPGVAIWVRVKPQATEWRLTVEMHNVTTAQAWAGYKESFVGRLPTTLNGQQAVVTVPAGTNEFLIWFTNQVDCEPMGVKGTVVPGNEPAPATLTPTPLPSTAPAPTLAPAATSVPNV
mgnify:CR=1 FL=1